MPQAKRLLKAAKLSHGSFSAGLVDAEGAASAAAGTEYGDLAVILHRDESTF